MENLHDWVNSAILLILGILYYSQDRILKYMKIALDTINIEKIKASQDYILQANEKKMELEMAERIKKIMKDAGARFQDVNKDFLEQYNELIAVPFGILKDQDWQEREKFLVSLPKNAPILRETLEAYDRGDFP